MFRIFAISKRKGSIAQLVQSVCLTSRGSGVRLPLLPPPERANQRKILKSTDFGIFCFMPVPFLYQKYHMSYIRINGAFNDEETMTWMQKQLQRYKEYGFGLWGVYNKKSGEMIGQCGITMQKYKEVHVPEIACI